MDPPWIEVAPGSVDLPARVPRMPLVRAGVFVKTVRGGPRARRRRVVRGVEEAKAPAEGDFEIEVAHARRDVVRSLGRLKEGARFYAGR